MTLKGMNRIALLITIAISVAMVVVIVITYPSIHSEPEVHDFDDDLLGTIGGTQYYLTECDEDDLRDVLKKITEVGGEVRELCPPTYGHGYNRALIYWTKGAGW